MTAPILEVEDLSVEFVTPEGRVQAVVGVDLEVRPGETLGVVGESGCGKTATALAVMGLLPGAGRVTGGSVRLAGAELLGLAPPDLRRVRGAEIGMVFQEPMTSLHPSFPVGEQLAEAILTHHPHLGRIEAERRAVELLGGVGVPAPERRSRDFPHTWSGGMRQRAMIAIAVANAPRVLIADEPTTALDVTIQAQVLELLRTMQAEQGLAMVLITHDLGVIAEMADRVAVMYAGRVVEAAPVERIFHDPRHPYTVGLLESLPRLDREDRRLPFVPGHLPPSANALPGCPFHLRCVMAAPRCREERPVLAEVEASSHRSACHFSSAIERRRWEEHVSGPPRRAPVSRAPLLEVEDLTVEFPVRKGRRLRVVDRVALRLEEGETLALVGESGCGKTTTARALLRLVEIAGGSVRFRGEDVSRFRGPELRRLRREMQIVFQDPYGSLNPRMSVGDIVATPLRIHRRWGRREGPRQVARLLDLVGLGPELARRHPAELSGGQRQRVGIARALALDPALLVLDEPVSALDVSIRAQILNLLVDLQDRLGLSYLLIAHDLAVVRHLADRVAVMYMGRIVETGSRDEVFRAPAHPYTEALLSAIPVADPRLRGRERLVLRGEVPSIDQPPSGCRFRTRCPFWEEDCARLEPELEGDGHRWACLHPLSG